MISCLDDRAVEGAALTDTWGEVVEPYQVFLRGLSGRGNGPSPPPGALGLTSCLAGEGVSTVAAQLAVAAACAGQPVLLADANFERPAVHGLFGLNLGPGLAEALRDTDRLRGFIQAAPVPNLAALTAGQLECPPLQAHDPSALAAVVAALKGDFPLVVFDLPAVARGSFAARLASLLDGVLLVVEAERVPGEVVRREKELLAQAGAPLLGAVLNNRRQYIPGWQIGRAHV